MECNKEEAYRAKKIAEDKMQGKDFVGARKILLKAKQLFPDLENVPQMLTVCEVHCSAEMKVSGETDWYAILEVDAKADETAIKKQYRKLALTLHPDKNQFAGAEAAFKLVGEAHRTLIDPAKRYAHDMKRGATFRTVTLRHPAPQSNRSSGIRKQTRVPAAAANKPSTQFNERRPSHPSAPTTFWTICPSCGMKYQYYQSVLNTSLRCQRCFNPFVASELNAQTVHSKAKPIYPEARQGILEQDVRGPAAHAAGQKSNVENAGSGMGFEDNVSGGPTSSKPGGTSRLNTVAGDVRSKVTEDGKTEHKVEAGNGLQFEKVSLGNVNKRQQVKPSASPAAKRLRKNEPKYSSDPKDSVMEKRPTEDGKDSKWKVSEESLPNRLQRDIKETTHKTACSEASSCNSSLKTPADLESVTYPDPEFFDFETKRRGSNFAVDQIWAVYDDLDGMPRFYAQIKNIYHPNFHVRFVWLENDPKGILESEWSNQELPVSCGNYRRGKFQITKEVQMFSHEMSWKQGSKRNSYNIYPRKGEIWALFKDWDKRWITDADNHRTNQYELVELLSDYTESSGTRGVSLVKINGFVSVFMRALDDSPVDIPPTEKLRFSHMIPSYILTGEEREGIPAGSFELDATCLPHNLAECFRSVSIDECKMRDVNSENISSGLYFKSSVEEKSTAGLTKINSSQQNEKDDEKYKSRDASPNWKNGSSCEKEAKCANTEQHSNLENSKQIETQAVGTERFTSVSIDRCKMRRNDLEDVTSGLYFKSSAEEKYTAGPAKANVSQPKEEKANKKHKSKDQSPHRQNGACKQEANKASRDEHSVSEAKKHVETESAALVHEVPTAGPALANGFQPKEKDSKKDKNRDPSPHRQNGACIANQTSREQHSVSETRKQVTTESVAFEHEVPIEKKNLDSLERTPPNKTYEYPEAEFSNFEEAKTIDKFACGQLWALYSDISTYPNYYGLITNVNSEESNVQVTWLIPYPASKEQKNWLEEMPVSCGTFKLTDQTCIMDSTETFSHQVKTSPIGRDGYCTIYPNGGEIWAMYKNWSRKWSRSNLEKCEYYVVEILARDESGYIKVLHLTKIHGHTSVFMPAKRGPGFWMVDVPASEYMKFSHQIPATKLSGARVGNLRGYWELDPASIPEILLKS